MDTQIATIDRVGSKFIRALLRRMKQLGLNQTSLAKRMNVSRAYVSKVLTGDVNISFSTAIRFARALEMDFIPTLAPVGKGSKKHGRKGGIEYECSC